MRILTDEVESHPVLGFEPYAECIVDAITGTDPKFSIGIYGEWGTGKTTLMELVRNKLNDHKNLILPIWFNAWRYEREEQFAITALMKTIAFAMGEHPIYKEMKPVIIRSLKLVAKGILSAIAAKFVSEKTIDELTDEKKIFPYIEFLTQFDKDTIYFDGIHNIEKQMEKILQQYSDTRIVVFIDDLDRCSPKRALEVFESVKVFLDIKGFIFIIGLSHETIAKLITAEYKSSGIKGEEYIRKIIQIPIILPSWNEFDARDIISNLLVRKKIDENYKRIIKDNKDIIATVVEPVPREIKRFINSFLISYRIYSTGSNIKPKELLIVQAMKFRWYDFYKYLSSDEVFRNIIKNLVKFDFRRISFAFDEKEFEKYGQEIEEKIKKEIDQRKSYDEQRLAEETRKLVAVGSLERQDMIDRQKRIEVEVRKDYEDSLMMKDNISVLKREYKSAFESLDAELWSILKTEEDTIFKIRDWDVYRRATEISKEIPTPKLRKLKPSGSKTKDEYKDDIPTPSILGGRPHYR
jgi:KAP family P-loop domain